MTINLEKNSVVAYIMYRYRYVKGINNITHYYNGTDAINIADKFFNNLVKIPSVLTHINFGLSSTGDMITTIKGFAQDLDVKKIAEMMQTQFRREVLVGSNNVIIIPIAVFRLEVAYFLRDNLIATWDQIKIKGIHLND